MAAKKKRKKETIAEKAKRWGVSTAKVKAYNADCRAAAKKHLAK